MPGMIAYNTPSSANLLQRTLEPEIMDSPQDAREYDSMDHSEVNQVFCRDFLDARLEPDGSSILDLGTGTAQIPIALCHSAPICQITAIDLADSMLTLARENVVRAGFSNRIQLAKMDAKKLPYPDNHFDAVISNSIIHHIPEPLIVFSEAVRVVKPGGLLFLRDLLRPPVEPAVVRLVKIHAAQASQYQQELFAASLRAALNEHEVREIVKSLGFPSHTVRQSSDRHWTWIGRKGCK